MTIHFFNPEHDLALAADKERFTPPHAARELRHCLSFLPLLWAEKGDYVLVDDSDFAERAAKSHKHYRDDVKLLSFVEMRNLLKNLSDTSFICLDVWGWDKAVRRLLLDCGISASILPSDKKLQDIRKLSSRHTAVESLAQFHYWAVNHPNPLIHDLIIGESYIETTIEGVKKRIDDFHDVVVKSPWSSSGRGVKYFNQQLTTSQLGWLRNTLKEQSTVVVEPFYRKICDFGLEFTYEQNEAKYEGLSIFYTDKTTWAGNIIASESDKREMLSKYLSPELLDIVIMKWIDELNVMCYNKYVGKLGIDLMIVKSENTRGYKLHPCVEINFRRTMGHVALAITPLSP